MSVIEDIVKGVVSPLTEPIDIIKDVIGKFSSGKDKMDAELALANLKEESARREHALVLAQLEINKKEAESDIWWKSGGRAFIIFVCGICLAIYYIPQFIVGTILWIMVFAKTGHLEAYPINPDSLFQLTFALLGFGAYKTAEKVTKIINSKISK